MPVPAGSPAPSAQVLALDGGPVELARLAGAGPALAGAPAQVVSTASEGPAFRPG